MFVVKICIWSVFGSFMQFLCRSLHSGKYRLLSRKMYQKKILQVNYTNSLIFTVGMVRLTRQDRTGSQKSCSFHPHLCNSHFYTVLLLLFLLCVRSIGHGRRWLEVGDGCSEWNSRHAEIRCVNWTPLPVSVTMRMTHLMDKADQPFCYYRCWGTELRLRLYAEKSNSEENANLHNKRIRLRSSKFKEWMQLVFFWSMSQLYTPCMRETEDACINRHSWLL